MASHFHGEGSFKRWQGLLLSTGFLLWIIQLTIKVVFSPKCHALKAELPGDT